MVNSFYILLILFTLLPINIFSQGLKFYGNECLINDRTSYTVFDNISPTFSDHLTIGFNISFSEPSHIGYILRVKNEEANTIYNLSFDSEGSDTVSFKLNEEGRSNLIVANLDKASLFEHHWINILISFDMKKDSITLKLNDHKFQIGEARLPKKWSPDIFFGRSDYIIDVPSYAIKNLIVKDDRQDFFFPLNENKGSLVHDIKGKVIGQVANPIWLINNAYYWKHRATFKSQTVAGANFDSEMMEVYFFNQDSISIYNIRTDNICFQKYANECPIQLKLGTSFINKTTKQLFAYEVNDIPAGSTSMACLDLNNYTWTSVTSQQLPIQLHHHGGYFDELSRKYTIFGGFGNLLYNKSFYSYNLNDDHWSTLTFGGDIITPRYFSSMGYKKDNNIIYIFGGMGNESGDQIVGRRYYYDFYKVDMNSQRITKLWEIPWNEDNVVPVRNMIVPNDSCFYTLCYPEHFSDSYLKLYRFSIKDGTYKVLGDSIPIHSEKIKTNANLYYNAKLNELYAIVQEFGNDDIASDVKIYSLSFPPITLDELSGNGINKNSRYLGWLIVAVLFFLLSVVIYFFKQKTKKQKQRIKENDLVEIKNGKTLHAIQNRSNAIYLFNGFSVRDRHNKEINYMFSAKLMQTFLLILQYSFGHGISSQQLSEALWPDRSENKVKNSRGVILNHLRKILNELDGINLVYEKGFFKIILTDECYCDCVHCIKIIESRDMEKNGESFPKFYLEVSF